MDATPQDAQVDGEADPKDGPQRPSFLGRLVQLPLAFGWLSAMLHFWPKDRWRGLSIWFYATPWGVTLALAVVTTLLCLMLKSKSHSPGTMRGALLLTLFSGGMWLWSDWNWQTASAVAADQDSRPIRLLVWNIAGGKRGWELIAREVHRHDSDVICFVEAGSASRRAMWQSFFPEYDVSMLGGRIVCMVRGTSGECNAVDLTPNSRLRILPVEVEGHTFQCAIVDIESSIHKSRETPLSRLSDELEQLEGPVVVAGDFNTPLDSVHLSRLGGDYASAFREMGAGYGATWPLPLPVLTLDQVWYGNGVAPRSFELGWSRASDHRPVIFEFTVND